MGSFGLPLFRSSRDSNDMGREEVEGGRKQRPSSVVVVETGPVGRTLLRR